MALAIGAPGMALADSTLTLAIGGEGFEGPPQFSVSFDGKPVGDGTVGSAIDTSKDGRFADAADKDKYVQTFSFKIADDIFKPDGLIAIKLTNEAHGAAGSKDDRELFVRSVAVNGDTVPANQLAMRSANGVEPTALLGDYVVVSQAAVEGIATPPDDGWPKAAVAAASPAQDVKPAPTPVAVAADAAPADKPAAALPVSPPATGKAVTAEVTKTVAASQPETTPPVPKPVADKTAAIAMADAEGAGANPNPGSDAPSCGLDKSFQVLGFNENSNELTPRTRRALDVVVKAIGTQRCVVHLTGYSSTEGDYAHNALFSIERSRKALHYLSAQGVKFRRFSANGVGETTQFGENPSANRRVVVRVSP